MADQNLANLVGNAKEAEAQLAEPLKRLLLAGSLNEHVLEINFDEEGLHDGAAKHLLGVSLQYVHAEFCAQLYEYTDASPA